MSSRYSGSRGSHRQPVVEQASSARPEPARRSVPDVHRSTRHSRDRDLHLQTSRSPQHRTVEPTHDEAVELAEAGSSWGQRFERSHKLEDLQRAIVAQERAFELMHKDHPERLRLLDNLGLSLWHRFNHLGKLDDLERSITLREQILDRTSDDDPDYHARQLSTLAISLHVRYQHLGELNDLRDSIAKSKAALRLMPENHPDRPRQLSNLGNSLYLLFERLGDIHDLEEAIATHRRAVDLTPEGHPKRPWWLDGLAGSLRDRFERLGDVRDLEEAIAVGRCSVELTPEGHPGHPARLTNLAIYLKSRFECLGIIRDLEEATAADKLAVNLTPEGHPWRPRLLHNFAWSLISRFEYIGDGRDLEEAIRANKRAVRLTPEGHPDRPKWLFGLGCSLRLHFEREQGKSRFDAALDCFMKATIQRLGNPITRLKSAQECVSLLSKYPQFSSAELVLSGHSRIIEIFPEIVWLGHSIERRYNELARLGPEVNATVSAFIRLQSRYQAIEWMEAGRMFVWAQMFVLREPLEDLERAYPTMAADLRRVSLAIRQSRGEVQPNHLQRTSDGPPVPTTSLSSGRPHVVSSEAVTQSASDHHRFLAIEYDKILKNIRRQPGFEDFLHPPKISSLLQSIRRLDGPVVLINVHSSSCDSLALFPNGGIEHIVLPNLNEELVRGLHKTWTQFLRSSGLRMRGVVPPGRLARGSTNMLGAVLGQLWTCIEHPILDALNFIVDEPPASHRLPHITWCPTGLLTQLPLHAAGIYDRPQTFSHVYDFVVSSYTPSLSALLRCHKQRGTPRSAHPNILLIAQPKTPGFAELPNTLDECRRLRRMMPKNKRTVLLDREGTVSNALDAMDQHPWVHIACHGLQSTTNPTQSQFALYDGPLTLSALMDRVANNAELAFLSACQTAVGDEKIPEESVHLAAGMLAVGFKGVVATMWSIGDADAPIVGKAYYKRLLKLRKSRKEGIIAPGYTGAAYALHRAVKVLRDQVGEQNFVKWAPFVHFGV